MLCFAAVLLFVWITQAISSSEVNSWDLRLIHNQTNLPKGEIIILCQTNTSLSKCTIRIYHENDRSTNYHDFSLGPRSPASDVVEDNGNLKYTARYHGSSLTRGQCGVKLTDVDMINALVTCRTRVEQSGWREASVAFDHWSAERTSLPHTVSVVSGGNTTIQCDTKQLHRCHINLFNTRNSDVLTPFTLERITDTEYAYDRLGGSDVCSFTLLNATNTDAGPIWCKAHGSSYTASVTILIIEKFTYNSTELLLTTDNVYSSGDTLTLQCRIKNTRPVANITWLLGSEVIRRDDVTDEEEWKLPWEDRSIMQQVSIRLRERDGDTNITCRVSHLSDEQESHYKITFTNCGVRNAGPSLISSGHIAARAEFPWHVGLYKKSDNTFIYQCGGTLITKSKVITAAHCFVNVYRGRVPDAQEYKVILGKQRVEYSHTESGTQSRDVTRVKIPVEFIGVLGSYDYDIALVTLEQAVDFTTTTQVVCVDWHNKLQGGELGVVPGWGLTENRTQSLVLRWAKLPRVSAATCRSAVSDERLQYLTRDKFCAGHVNTSISVCGGDSGGGWVVRDDSSNRYYLRGVVSVSLEVNLDRSCYSRLYTGFTNVSLYLAFIQDDIQ